jgi:PAS domain S-box-containing protein
MPTDARVILIVDDEPGTAMLQQRRLVRAGYVVKVAADVEAAMNVLGETGHVDLILMDYRLGATSGIDLNRRIKAAGFDVPVILVSASMSDAMVIEAMRAGIRDVVIKNLDYLDQLPEAVRGVLDQAARPVRPRRTGPATQVLIVEDDPGVASLQRRQLRRAGYEVAVASTVDEARAQVRQGGFGVAVLDLRLDGGVSGLDLYEQLKAEGHQLPAILVTAFPDQAVAIRALRAGIRDFVPKSPEYLDHLPTTLDRVMEQVRLERKLVESELRLASIIGTTMDAIVMCDEDGQVVLFNRSAEEMFGVDAADALGRPVQAMVPGLTLLPDRAVPAGGLQRRFEVEAVHSGGERIPIEVSVSDVVVHDRRLLTVIARDISERKRTEQELREADRRKDVFLGMLAHELRNPLAAITTAGEVMHRTLHEPGAQRLVDVIRRQAGALARMINDLLDVSRVTMGKIELAAELVELGDLVGRAVDSFQEAAASGGVTLAMEPAPDAVWVLGDTTRLEQVIANLLTNALKFTPAGGTVRAGVSHEAGDALVRVQDTGAGIDAQLLPRIFDLFVQGDTSLDRSKSGLGIGLALVRQVVMLHGGTVQASSRGPGLGAAFTVRLRAAAPPQTTAAPTRRPGAPQRRLKVLVVDDQPDLADLIALLAETMGHEARALYDGEQALTAARVQVPDVLFVDIGMPIMNGYELARRVREDAMLVGVRLIALTGYGRDEDRARVMEAGFDVHLTKPVSEAELRDVLDRVG